MDNNHGTQTLLDVNHHLRKQMRKKNRWAVAAFDGSDGERELPPQQHPPAQGKLVYGGTRKLAALRPRGRL